MKFAAKLDKSCANTRHTSQKSDYYSDFLFANNWISAILLTLTFLTHFSTPYFIKLFHGSFYKLWFISKDARLEIPSIDGLGYLYVYDITITIYSRTCFQIQSQCLLTYSVNMKALFDVCLQESHTMPLQYPQ